MKQLLFVCTGNTCRSPMAELYFNRFCLLRGFSGARALSAGIAAVPGAPGCYFIYNHINNVSNENR